MIHQHYITHDGSISTHLQSVNYYLFLSAEVLTKEDGMLITESQYNEATYDYNRYLYNGKELQDDFELDWYDYGARYYDPQLGRWHVVDPLAEEYFEIAPFTYVANNPIKYIDPNGLLMDEYELNTRTGQLTMVKDTDNDIVYAVKTNTQGETVRTGDKVTFEGEPITNVKQLGLSPEGIYAMYIEVNNTSDGDKLFTFLKEQTGEQQEWGIVDYSSFEMDPTSEISTSGKKGEHGLFTNRTEVFLNKSGTKIHRADHNHPDNDETEDMSSDGDRTLRDKVIKNNSDAKVNIHWKGKNKWLHRSIVNDTKIFNDGK